MRSYQYENENNDEFWLGLENHLKIFRRVKSRENRATILNYLHLEYCYNNIVRENTNYVSTSDVIKELLKINITYFHPWRLIYYYFTSVIRMYSFSSNIESLRVIIYNLMNTFELYRSFVAKIYKSISRRTLTLSRNFYCA